MSSMLLNSENTPTTTALDSIHALIRPQSVCVYESQLQVYEAHFISYHYRFYTDSDAIHI